MVFVDKTLLEVRVGFSYVVLFIFVCFVGFVLNCFL